MQMAPHSPRLHADLERIHARPEPFAAYTADVLWTDPHISARMLAHHLDGTSDLSSRNASFIDRSIDWLVSRFDIGPGCRIIDFGCGPGLYTSRLARLGAQVTGVDFSTRSIDHAREYARRKDLRIDYQRADYLRLVPRGEYDLILMIMCDFCALSPEQRATLLGTFAAIASSRARIVLDVHSLCAFRNRAESSTCERNLMNGFWSPDAYYGFMNVFIYEAEKVTLDKYTIVEPERSWEVYNWLQYCSVDTLEEELGAAGLEIEDVLSSVAGDTFDADSDEFAVVARGTRG